MSCQHLLALLVFCLVAVLLLLPVGVVVVVVHGCALAGLAVVLRVALWPVLPVSLVFAGGCVLGTTNCQFSELK